MSGIFYDPHTKRIRRVEGTPLPEWTFVTHNLAATPHHCRRIMKEWLPTQELWLIDWSAVESQRAEKSA